MRKSEVVKTLLESYCFQEGKRANKRVISKAETIIKQFEKEELELEEIDVVADGITDITDLIKSGKKLFIQKDYVITCKNGRFKVVNTR